MGFSTNHSHDLSPRQFSTTCQLFISLALRTPEKWDSHARLHKIRIPWCLCLITALGRIRRKSLPRSARRAMNIYSSPIDWKASFHAALIQCFWAPKTRERCQKAHLIKLTPNWKMPCVCILWDWRSRNFGCRRCMRICEKESECTFPGLWPMGVYAACTSIYLPPLCWQNS